MAEKGKAKNLKSKNTLPNLAEFNFRFSKIGDLYATEEGVQNYLGARLLYLRNLVMTRGRFVEEADVSLEFESCERILGPRAKVPHIKQEPGLYQGNYMDVKNETFSEDEYETKPGVSGDANLKFEEFDETLRTLKEEN